MTACEHFAIVPAAGSGTRIGDLRPKQYLSLAGRPMLEHAVRTLARHPAIACVFIVLAAGDTHYGECEWREHSGKIVPLYCGGPNRACSVFNALMAIRGRVDDDDWMLVHDAARPCLSTAELERLLHTLDGDTVGGLLALPLVDTLKRADQADRVAATEPREGLWRALTPQMFRYRLLVEALRAAGSAYPTDESAAVERLGLCPRLVPGAATNVKVTYADDLSLAASIIECRDAQRCA